MAYKVFTNGSTLQASEVNDNLMKQAVATFSNAAARTAAITSPVEGQLTYLEDINLYQHWNGAAWVSPFGATLVSSVSFTGSSGVSQNNVFSSIYDNYLMQISISAISTTGNLLMRMRSGGSDYTGNLHFYTGINTSAVSSTVSVDNGQGVGFAYLQTISAGASGDSVSNVQIMNPFLTRATRFLNHSNSTLGDTRNVMNGGSVFTETSYDGVTIYPASGTITGTIRIYGMRNA